MNSLWILPTRGRRKRAERCVEAIAATRETDARLIVAADIDDRETYDGMTLPPWAELDWGPRGNLGSVLNLRACVRLDQYDAIGFLADDTVPVTPGWDRLLLEQLATPGVACPANGIRPDSQAGEHWLVSTVISRALGWYHPPYVSHFWGDTIITELADELGILRFVADARVDHLQYQHTTQAERDALNEIHEAGQYADHVGYARWQAWGQKARDLDKVRAAIGPPAPS